MATVVLQAHLPSVRLGLAAMLREHGHSVVAAQDAEEGAVWVVDDPGGTFATHPSFAEGEDGGLVVLTDDASVAPRLAAQQVHGWACLGRDADASEVDLAVRAAESGLVLMSLPMAGHVTPRATRSAQLESGGDVLTPREQQVLQLVAQGLPNKGIARALNISENTAKFHVGSLSGKLGAASRTEAVTIAARRGLLVL